MRRLLVLLVLITLLPLRSWAGDAMVIQMAAQAHGSGVATMTSPPAEHANCHEMQAEAPQAASDSQTQGDCATCIFCQACFTVAIALPALSSGAQTLPHGLPQTGHAQFSSAILALRHKPPIS